MTRMLGIDFGEKRVGIAISDPTGAIARPLAIVTRQSNRQVAEAIAALAREQQVETVVVGLPLDSSGDEGYQARRVRRFAGILEAMVTVPLVYWDETLSSVDAEQALRDAGAHKKRRRAPTDDVAAAVLLQAYMNSRPRVPPPSSVD
jgi:putative holliday junction resolvase